MIRDYMNKDNDVMVIFIYPQQKNCRSLVFFYCRVIFLIDIRKFHNIVLVFKLTLTFLGSKNRIYS